MTLERGNATDELIDDLRKRISDKKWAIARATEDIAAFERAIGGLEKQRFTQHPSQ